MRGAEEKMRKTKIICIFSIICMTMFLQVGCGQKNDVPEDIAVQGSFVEFSYEELKDTAKIIQTRKREPAVVFMESAHAKCLNIIRM